MGMSALNVPSLIKQASHLNLSSKLSQFVPDLVLQAKSAPEDNITEIDCMTRSRNIFKLENYREPRASNRRKPLYEKEEEVLDAEAEEFVKILE